MSFGPRGFHMLLVTSMIIFLGSRAVRVWGFDAWLLGRAGEPLAPGPDVSSRDGHRHDGRGSSRLTQA